MSTGDFTIQNNNSPDIELIKELVTTWAGDDFTRDYFLRGLHINTNLVTIEALENNQLVGLLTVWKSVFHPHCTYFSIVSKSHLDYEIEAALIGSLYQLEDIQSPLQTSIWETSYKLKNFYEDNGFKEVRRTYSPLLKTSKLDYGNLHIQCLHLKDLNSVVNNPELKEELTQLVKDNYAKTHQANPVGEHSLEKWEELIFDEDTILDGSFILLKNNVVHAYALLHHSNHPKQFEFGWRGTRDDADSRILLMLTAKQINYAFEKGVQFIEAEIDTTDSAALKMLKYFSFLPAPTLITYQKALKEV
ncbi:hypothetical protein M3649_09275 [Ureibacillus chungkukjangi]|uniref:hypothetical protein n=1 Tax=Ureibacillus chungkukjangi TaxID=1202712 RepID=UPI00204024A0|nr:hypothetical protein [Ureibacillus chungkukjangi]MCM3388324.1 hypothetical protein [Ureibacillus chungkukjangi]